MEEFADTTYSNLFQAYECLSDESKRKQYDAFRGGGFGGGGSGFGGGQVEHKVYVGKLSFDATVEDLRYAFQEHGEITDVFIPKDHESKESRGFAFVTFTTLDSANAAIAALNGAEIAGREVECNLAKPKGRGGRGRGRQGQGYRDGGRGEY